MINNSLIENNGVMFRVLDTKDTKAFVINCNKQSMPKWVDKGIYLIECKISGKRYINHYLY